MDNFAQFRESQYELRGLNTDNLELSVNPQITMETDTSLENILEGKAPFLPKQMPFTSSSTSPIKPVLANIFKVFQKENKSEEEISLSDLKHFQFESQFQHSKQAEEEKFKSSEISRNKDKKGESQRKEENYAKYMSKIEEVEKEEEINNSLLPSMYLEEESPRLPPLPANQNINISNPSRSSQINQFNKKSLMRIKELDQSPYQSLEVPGASGLGSICQTKDPYKVMASPLAILSKDKSLSQVNGLYSQIIFLKQQIQKDFTHCKSEHVLNEVKGSLYSEINKELDSHIDNFEKERNKMGDSLIKTYQELEKVSKEIEEIIENSAEMDLKHLQNLRSKVSDLNNKVKKQKITEFPAEVQITPKEEVNNMKLFNNSLKRELFKANNSIEKLHNQIEKQENQLDEYKLQESQLISKLQRVPDKENLPSFQSVPNAEHTGSPISKRNPLASSILKEVTNKPSHAAYSSLKTSQKTTPRYREPLQIHNLSEETIKSTQFNQINPLTHSKSISPNQQISQRNQINQINQINEINDRTELNEVSEFNERSKGGDFNKINEFSLINQNSQNTNQIRQGDIQIKAKLSYLLDHVKAFHKSLINNSRVSFCKSIIYKQSGFESHVHVPKSLDQIVDEIGQALDELYSKMESSCKSKEEAFNTMLIKIKNTHLKKLLTIKQEHSSKLEVIQTHIQTEGKNDRSLYQEQLHLNKENETCIFISQCENERLNSELLELKAEVDNLQQENTIIKRNYNEEREKIENVFDIRVLNLQNQMKEKEGKACEEIQALRERIRQLEQDNLGLLKYKNNFDECEAEKFKEMERTHFKQLDTVKGYHKQQLHEMRKALKNAENQYHAKLQELNQNCDNRIRLSKASAKKTEESSREEYLDKVTKMKSEEFRYYKQTHNFLLMKMQKELRVVSKELEKLHEANLNKSKRSDANSSFVQVDIKKIVNLVESLSNQLATSLVNKDKDKQSFTS